MCLVCSPTDVLHWLFLVMKKYTLNVRYEKYLDLLVLTVTSVLFIASYSTFKHREIL